MRHWFKIVHKKYNLDEKIVCDAGCGPGHELETCGPGSFGLDNDWEKIIGCAQRGLTVTCLDFDYESSSYFFEAEVVWVGALLEHVRSPRFVLTELRTYLPDNGLMIVYSSTVPLLRPYWKYFRGWQNSTNTYTFTPLTLKFLCERAGFRTIKMFPKWPLRGLICGTVWVGRKVG